MGGVHGCFGMNHCFFLLSNLADLCRFDVPINVARKSTDALVNLLVPACSSFLDFHPAENMCRYLVFELLQVISYARDLRLELRLFNPTGSLNRPLHEVSLSAVLAVLATRSAYHLSLASCLSSLGESLPSVPDAHAVAVSGVPRDGSRVHTYDHGGSEAPDGSPDSILSSEPKPLRKHRPPPP
ncbi:hypothetical protein Tco_1418937 [Tanacetum coccineum]